MNEWDPQINEIILVVISVSDPHRLYCFSMCEIDLPLSGRMNDKQLFAHGQSAIFS
jgi:hypothetical protein